jgi:hypothetical protein
MEQKCYVLRKTQTSVGCRTEPSRASARFYIGALCNSAIKLAAPKGGAVFLCVRLSRVGRRLGEGQKPECARCEASARPKKIGGTDRFGLSEYPEGNT